MNYILSIHWKGWQPVTASGRVCVDLDQYLVISRAAPEDQPTIERFQYTKDMRQVFKQTFKGYHVEQRPDWEQIRDRLCWDQLVMKHDPLANPHLADALTRTGDELLVEYTTGSHDNYWDVCRCKRCRALGLGLNRYGQLLMELRGYLRSFGSKPTGGAP